jgi:hypothetical protein
MFDLFSEVEGGESKTRKRRVTEARAWRVYVSTMIQHDWVHWEEPNHGIGEELRAVEEVGMVVGVKLNDRKGMSLRPFYRLNNNFILQVMGAVMGSCPRAPVFTLRGT